LLLCSHPRFSFVVIFSVSGRSSHFPSHLLYPPLVENRDAKSFCLTRAQDAAFTSSPDRLWRALPDAFKTQIQEIRDGHAAKVCVCVGGRMHWQSLNRQKLVQMNGNTFTRTIPFAFFCFACSSQESRKESCCRVFLFSSPTL
jgi:hypothetical protein